MGRRFGVIGNQSIERRGTKHAAAITIRSSFERPQEVERRIFRKMRPSSTDASEITPMIRSRSLILAALLCGGCNYAPNVPVFGAFFPAWMLCALVGIGCAVILRVLSAATGLSRRVDIPPATYPLLAMLFAAAGWILFFRG
jgi:hypothetical protein